MQITEKLRTEIALCLPILGLSEANRIARECGCSNDTVYREWRKIRGVTPGRTSMDNPVVLAIAELAVQRRRETKERAKRSDKIIRQLSA